MQCHSSFTDYLIQCPEGINVNLVADVGPYVDLTWQIINHHGNIYTGDVVTNGLGGFTIPVSDLPDGLLSSYSGTFELKVMDEGRPVNFSIAGYYDSILFDVRRGEAVKDNLGVPCP